MRMTYHQAFAGSTIADLKLFGGSEYADLSLNLIN